MSSRSRAKRSAETAEDEKPPRKKTAPEKARAKQSASKRQRRVEPESESETATQDTSESYEQSSIEREEQQIPTKRRVSARKRKQPVFYDEHNNEDESSSSKSSEGAPDKPKVEAPKKGIFCEECLEDDAKESLVWCDSCWGGFHRDCVGLKGKKPNPWKCPNCEKWQVPVEQILTYRLPDPLPKRRPNEEEYISWQFYVKWQGYAHKDNDWVEGRWLDRMHKQKLRTFVRKATRPMDPEEVVNREWLQIDRIVTESNENGKEYLIKWQGLPYDQCTWEEEFVIKNYRDFKQKLSRYHAFSKGITERDRSKEKPRVFHEFKDQPAFLKHGDNLMYDYQLDGLNWLRYSWSKHNNAILADEMGLGKTVQTIAFVCSLYEEGYMPSLIIVPLSTLGNWEREFSVWAPHLNVVTYIGSAEARQVIREYEWTVPEKGKTKSSKDKERRPKFHAVLTTYDMVIQDSSVFRPFHWDLLVVDEGHRLKNRDSRLFQLLKDYSTSYRVLLTGTPLQNNLSELFNLLEFLQLPQFKKGTRDGTREEIEKDFEHLDKEEKVQQLHQILRPHFLRRMKKEVMPILPPKAEILVPVTLSPLQKEYYKAILTKNYKILSGRNGRTKTSLQNIVMELQKCCNHPYLIPGAEPECKSPEEEQRLLIEVSSKLSLLHRFLPKLQARGHRVLLFSQMTQMLDIIEDYLRKEKIEYDRLDGAVPSADRQQRIDRFNAPNSKVFIFLLSTRACRLGINLASADTVIIYDSDWNPHNDIQAFSRVHRIGQTKEVMIYRLFTKNTIEEGVIERARKKLLLEHLIVQKMGKELKEGELEDLMKIGTRELFKKDEPAQEIRYDDETIDKLLDRSQVSRELEPEEGQNEYLSTLKEARVWDVHPAVPPAQEEASAPDYWQNLLGEKALELEREAQEGLGKGKRKRKQVHYVDWESSSEDDDEDFDENAEGSSSSEDEEISDASADAEQNGKKKPASRKRKTGLSYTSSLPQQRTSITLPPLPDRSLAELSAELATQATSLQPLMAQARQAPTSFVPVQQSQPPPVVSTLPATAISNALLELLKKQLQKAHSPPASSCTLPDATRLSVFLTAPVSVASSSASSAQSLTSPSPLNSPPQLNSPPLPPSQVNPQLPPIAALKAALAKTATALSSPTSAASAPSPGHLPASSPSAGHIQAHSPLRSPNPVPLIDLTTDDPAQPSPLPVRTLSFSSTRPVVSATTGIYVPQATKPGPTLPPGSL